MDAIVEIFGRLSQTLEKIIRAIDIEEDQAHAFMDWKCCGFIAKQRMLAISSQRDIQRLRAELLAIYLDLQECQDKLQQCLAEDEKRQIIQQIPARQGLANRFQRDFS